MHNDLFPSGTTFLNLVTLDMLNYNTHKTLPGLQRYADICWSYGTNSYLHINNMLKKEYTGTYDYVVLTMFHFH